MKPKCYSAKMPPESYRERHGLDYAKQNYLTKLNISFILRFIQDLFNYWSILQQFHYIRIKYSLGVFSLLGIMHNHVFRIYRWYWDGVFLYSHRLSHPNSEAREINTDNNEADRLNMVIVEVDEEEL